MKRLSILFLFVYTLSYSQVWIHPNYTLNDTFPIEDLIKGDWILEETKINSLNENDSSSIISIKWKHQLRISEDKISVSRDTNEYRFYRPNINEQLYTIDYDSISKDYSIVFWDKKKKRKIDSYRILKCTFDELIYEAFENGDNLNLNNTRTIYKFKRPYSKTNSLSGDWYYRGCDFIFMGFVDSDTTKEIILYRSKELAEKHLDSVRNPSQIMDGLVSFRTQNLIDKVHISSHTEIIGGALWPCQFFVNSYENLIYFFGEQLNVYRFAINKEGNLHLQKIQNVISSE
jgi:hypothetical protein